MIDRIEVDVVTEWRGLMQEFRNLIESDSLVGETNTIDAWLDSIREEIRRVVTHAAVWVVLLIVLVFALMLIYRAIAKRFVIARSAA